MDRIKQLYQSLSKTELRYLKNYLTAFHNKGKNKSLELIRILGKKPEISQDEISEQLYGDPKSKAFLMLKKRLLEKMLETLSLSINFHNNPIFKNDPNASGSIEILKELTYGMILRRRGVQILAKEIFEKCVKRAEALNLPEYKILALMHLQNISTSEKELRAFGPKIKLAVKQFETDIKGGSIYDEYRILNTERTSKDANVIDFFNEKLPALKKQLDTCYSPRAHYYYLHMKGKLSKYQNDYLETKELYRKMISIVDAHRGLQSKKRQCSLKIQLSALEISYGHFEKARQVAAAAMEVFHSQTKNFFYLLLYRIFACIYSDNIDEALSLVPCIEEFANRNPKSRSVKIARYLQSCLAYINEDFKTAGYFLQQTRDLFADKDGWNMGLRIYEIFLLIDQEKFDVASSKIETLRKHIARYDPDKRTVLIYKYLYLLEKKSFLFSNETETQKKILRDLATQDPWEPASHEVIKFEVWLKAKKEQKAFYPLLKKELQTLYNVNNT